MIVIALTKARVLEHWAGLYRLFARNPPDNQMDRFWPMQDTDVLKLTYIGLDTEMLTIFGRIADSPGVGVYRVTDGRVTVEKEIA